MLLICLVLTYVSAVEELDDFPGCGLRNAPSLNERGDDECLWDCTWVTNPFYRKSWNIRLVDQHLRDPNQANQKVVFKDVRYIMTTPRIPRDLSCLANCRLPEVVNYRPDRNCTDATDGYFNCYMNSKKRNAVLANTRTKDDCMVQEDGKLNSTYVCQYTAGTPRDLIIEVCYIAMCFREDEAIKSLYKRKTCKQLKIIPESPGSERKVCPPSKKLRLKRKKRLPKRKSSQKSVRVSGASSQHAQPETPLRYPWLCSLKTRGFRGRHLCSATLLSAPPRPTILVSTAHCNYICKDGESILEVCCCRPSQEPTSCQNSSSYCQGNPKMMLARPLELQIVCGSYSNGEVPELLSEADEVVLHIVSFSNHQQYDPTKGPINGYDIAVYKVDDKPLRASGVVSRKTIWPICFPKKEYLEGVPGILAGWRDPRPSYFSLNNQAETANDYRLKNLETRQVRMEQMAKCEDPAWMKIPYPGTFYPAGVVCARDPSGASCLQFGNSGSGLMRAYIGQSGGPYWYSWVGSLSMYKGCDQAATGYKLGARAFNSQRGDNPGIFTQASCHLAWIAEQYGMTLGRKLQEVARDCSEETGTQNPKLRKGCKTNLGTECDFTATYEIRISRLRTVPVKMDQCKLLGLEGYSGNIFFCVDTSGTLATCANNCPGVDPNAIVVGGAALATAAAAGAAGILQPFFALGGLGATMGLTATALGMMARANCSPPYCRNTRGQCCLLIATTRGLRCPQFCG